MKKKIGLKVLVEWLPFHVHLLIYHNSIHFS